jgi:hypothetical protein
MNVYYRRWQKLEALKVAQLQRLLQWRRHKHAIIVSNDEIRETIAVIRALRHSLGV